MRKEVLALGPSGKYVFYFIMTGKKEGAVPLETQIDSRVRLAGLGISQGSTASLLILGLLVAASFLPAVWAGFVWDDEIIRRIEAVRSWGGIWDLWFSPSAVYHESGSGEDHYWPLVYTTFWVEHKLWGFHPLGYHALNLLLHFVNTALLWRLLLRLRVPGAFFAAAVFAVHPLHVESVAWVIARKDLLSAFFYLTAVLMWLRYSEVPRLRCYVTAILLFTAGMLCKSIVVTLPATLLILQWWRHGSLRQADLLRTLPFFLVGFAIALADMSFYESRNISFDYSVAERVLIAAHALWFYIGKLAWPVDLAVMYPHWDVSVSDFAEWGYVIATLAVGALFWLLRNRVGRGPLACALFFAVTLSPVLGFLPFGYMNISFVADRYQYLAGIGAIVLFAGTASRGVARLPRAGQGVGKTAALGLLALLGVATWNQSGFYKDSITFFGRAVSVNPESWAAHCYVGGALFNLGRYAEAENHFRRSVELDQSPADSFLMLAFFFRNLQRYGESLEAYRSAVEADPGFARAYAEMGDLLFQLRRYEESIENTNRVISLVPDHHQLYILHYRMGEAALRLNRLDDAEKHYENALRAKPDFKEAANRLDELGSVRESR